MDRLRALQAFVRVAELGSFTAAGRELRVTQSQVSRAVRELEREVESQLFTRSTRRVVLTPEGQRYLHGVRDALRTLDAANDAVRTDSRAVSGTLRVTAPAELGEYLTPVMTALIAEHPALSIDSLLTDRLVDLIDEGFDVAIRVGPMAPSALRARRLGTNLAVLCASPAYARAHELPRHPRDLREHAFVLFTGKRNPERLTLVDGRGHAAQVRLAGRLRTN
jgi:DNA-binding transcriptional LysR family regulator